MLVLLRASILAFSGDVREGEDTERQGWAKEMSPECRFLPFDFFHERPCVWVQTLASRGR